MLLLIVFVARCCCLLIITDFCYLLSGCCIWTGKPTCSVKMSWRGWLVLGYYIPFADFQKYRAVLDLDGGSWSERFPRLLCQNSVVVKVDPEQIDYFWPTLQAGVHYVAANLTNLVSVIEYVTSDDHQEEMQQIVANAREWCRQHMVCECSVCWISRMMLAIVFRGLLCRRDDILNMLLVVTFLAGDSFHAMGYFVIIKRVCT